MTADILPMLAACVSCFGLTVVSAVVPWVNAEVVLLSFTATAPSHSMIALFVVITTAGQMLGKLALYSAGRHGWMGPSGRMGGRLDSWRVRCIAHPARADWFVFASSATGFPPFILMSVLAGAVRMNIVRFLMAGSIGRLLHFGAIAAAGELVVRLL